ncbi:uncharacterized protein BDZ83DRAFT_275097 [Colletotrichum acutatum]|uniref:Uncharacterized protein n=1 Tax=Glomerella acutata TaxID=27357 RepID=A0AAD8XFK6_GLOAC|nr:uncharacterized protein BDZ83DRAFT_275097 [Colletotrichum acutatum]KAK1725984.1 hypothetical protein BDZ83DRAFT_275097 [Colletotrichum acutatum]
MTRFTLYFLRSETWRHSDVAVYPYTILIYEYSLSRRSIVYKVTYSYRSTLLSLVFSLSLSHSVSLSHLQSLGHSFTNTLSHLTNSTPNLHLQPSPFTTFNYTTNHTTAHNATPRHLPLRRRRRRPRPPGAHSQAQPRVLRRDVPEPLPAGHPQHVLHGSEKVHQRRTVAGGVQEPVELSRGQQQSARDVYPDDAEWGCRGGCHCFLHYLRKGGRKGRKEEKLLGAACTHIYDIVPHT